jgi:peptidyl-prolyl cis-trans isomerase B (cyclophilin B)
MKKLIAIIALLAATSTMQAQNKATDKGMAKPKKEKQTMVDIKTDYGTIRIKLYNETPKHRDNFIKLAKEGYYNGTLFHRVIKGFMLQGGDPNSKTAGPDAQLGSGDIGYTIPAEFNPNLFHKKGALCAARTPNPEKASSGCQFYIVQGKISNDAELSSMESRGGKKFSEEQKQAYKTVGGTPFLDGDYTVFGETVSGLDVIDKICAVQTKPGDRPVQDVKMTVTLVQ